MAELSQQFDVHANQIKQWKDHLLEGEMNVFYDGRKENATPAVDVKNLHAKISEMTLENDAPRSRVSPLRWPARSTRPDC